MSLALLLVPNNLGPFFMGTITFITLNATNIITTNITASSILTEKIDANAPGGDLLIGTTNAGQISFGNSANVTSFNFSNAGSMLLPNAASLTPYQIASSGIEVSTNLPLSAAVNTGTALVIFRRIGNWIDIYVNNPSSVSVGITNTNAISIAGALPTGYRPARTFTFSCMVIDTGVTPQNVAGQCTIDLSGSINIQRLGPTNWTVGANWGFNTITCSFPII